MSDTYNDMYEADDSNTTEVVGGHQTVDLQQKGMFTEIDINGKKVSIVNVAVIAKLENTIKHLQSRVAKLENDLRNATNRLSSAERRTKTLATELDNKVSYE